QAAGLRGVRTDHGLTDLAQPEGPHGLALGVGGSDGALDLGHLDVCHHQAPCPARARSIAAGATSSICLPRAAATSSGRLSDLRPATVACTTLMALSLPSDLDRMSCTPAHSSTARTAPPAMTPVPGLAGRSMTTPPEVSPWTGCGMVPAIIGTRKKFLRASSTPFWIAAGTSFALP